MDQNKFNLLYYNHLTNIYTDAFWWVVICSGLEMFNSICNFRWSKDFIEVLCNSDKLYWLWIALHMGRWYWRNRDREIDAFIRVLLIFLCPMHIYMYQVISKLIIMCMNLYWSIWLKWYYLWLHSSMHIDALSMVRNLVVK